MKHILFISNLPSGGWGGSEELWSLTALRLLERGYKISASVNSSPDNARIRDLIAGGAHIERRSSLSYRYRQAAEIIYRDGSGNLPAHKRLVLKAVFRASWYRAVRKLRPDFAVISQTDNFNGWDWMRACHESGVPFAPIAESANEYVWPTLGLAEQIAGYYGLAERQFFVSQRNLDLTRLQIPHSFSQAEIVRNPFGVSYDLQSIVPMPDISVLKLACVGRLHIPSKGQDLVCQVMALEKWRERPIEVTFYGNGEHKSALQRMIDRLGLEKVRIAGFSRDIQQIWNECHGLLLPSRWEGLPLVVVEAMLCGRIPIVTDVAGNSEVISDGKTGFIASGATIAALDDALERAWSFRSLWPQIGADAARSIRTLVPEDPAGELASKIETLIASKNG